MIIKTEKGDPGGCKDHVGLKGWNDKVDLLITDSPKFGLPMLLWVNHKWIYWKDAHNKIIELKTILEWVDGIYWETGTVLYPCTVEISNGKTHKGILTIRGSKINPKGWEEDSEGLTILGLNKLLTNE